MFKKMIMMVALMATITATVQAQKGIDYKTYSIQISSFSKVLDDDEFQGMLKKYDNLTDLGYVYETSYLSQNNMVPSKFYLGSYVGLHTAKAILSKVKRRGYKDAYIVAEYKAKNPSVTGFHKVVQLGSYKKLYMNQFKKLADGVGQGYVLVTLADNGSYKVLLASFEDDDVTDELIDAKEFKFQTWKRDIRDIYKLKNPIPVKKKSTARTPPNKGRVTTN
jgi:hypothetical protein